MNISKDPRTEVVRKVRSNCKASSALTEIQQVYVCNSLAGHIFLCLARVNPMKGMSLALDGF